MEVANEIPEGYESHLDYIRKNVQEIDMNDPKITHIANALIEIDNALPLKDDFLKLLFSIEDDSFKKKFVPLLMLLNWNDGSMAKGRSLTDPISILFNRFEMVLNNVNPEIEGDLLIAEAKVWLKKFDKKYSISKKVL